MSTHYDVVVLADFPIGGPAGSLEATFAEACDLLGAGQAHNRRITRTVRVWKVPTDPEGRVARGDDARDGR